MSGFFRFLGIAVGVYVAHCLSTGAVHVRHRMWGRTVQRDDEAVAYWSAIAAYVVLALLLLFVF